MRRNMIKAIFFLLLVVLWVERSHAGFIRSPCDPALKGALVDDFSSCDIGGPMPSINRGAFTITTSNDTIDNKFKVVDNYGYDYYGIVGRNIRGNTPYWHTRDIITIDFDTEVSAVGIHLGSWTGNWKILARGGSGAELGYAMSARTHYTTTGFFIGWAEEEKGIASIELSQPEYILGSFPEIHLDNLHYVPKSEIYDEDNDGFGSDIDCDDLNPEINPNQIEIPANMIDENCDGDLGSCSPCLEWKNHGQYVRCTAQAVEALVASGDLTEEEGDVIISSSAQSSIGGKGYIPTECQ